MAESLDLDKMNLDVEALNFMAQGKRHLLVHDYSSAVQCLEDACRLYDQKYGINADECADAYLKYGHALLELHRHETGALDGLVDTKQTGDTDAEDEEEEEDEELGDEETADVNGKDEQPKSTNEENGNKLSVTVNEEDISTSPTPPAASQLKEPQTSNGNTACSLSTSNGNALESTVAEEKPASSANTEMETDQVDPNQPSTSTGITDENRGEEEDLAPTNIEVAFEVLTMAENIFQRQLSYRDDANLKLADALQKLGEILYEWENNEDALKKLNECLEIRKRHLPDDDRLIAETYYHIGLTYSLSSKIDDANSNFQKAVDVIEQRLSRLKCSYTDEQDVEKKDKIENEIKELEFVLPEMKSRIEDSQDQMSTIKLATVTEENEKLEEEKIAEKKKQILAKPISNVSHLVKRKREQSVEPEASNKKLKNGTENGCEPNGHNVEMKE